MTTQGLLLAAGAGTRMGRPKALVSDADGSWLERGVRLLDDGGCEGVTVVLGARSSEAVSFLDGLGVDVVIAHDWESGMSASLCAGLRGMPAEATAALVLLVDLPDLTAEVVRRVLDAGTGPDSLARASYAGRPGHPCCSAATTGRASGHRDRRPWRQGLPRRALPGRGRVR